MSPEANKITLCDVTIHQLTLVMRLHRHFWFNTHSTLLYKYRRLLKLKVRVLIEQTYGQLDIPGDFSR